MAEWFSEQAPVRQLPVADRGLQYGDGLFETIAIRNGSPRLWSLHCARLAKGCKALAIRMPDEAQLSDGIAHALAASAISDAYCTVKVIVTAGPSQRGYGRSASASPTVLFGVFASLPLPASYYLEGVTATICRTRLATHSPTAGLKTLNRLEQVLARSELVEPGVFEGLTLDADDNVICGTMSNVFFIKEQSISTPPIDASGVAGVMREHVLNSMAATGRDVLVQNFSQSDLGHVDEVFVCNSQFGIVPVAACDNLHWGVGEMTRQVMTTMAGAGVAECQT